MAEPDIPEAELEILTCLQRRGKATAAELREALRSFRPLAHASVATLLQRLERRKLITREKGPVGKAFVYRPTRGSGLPLRTRLRRIVHRAFGGDSSALVASLFESKPPTQEELERVQQLLDRLRDPQAKKK